MIPARWFAEPAAITPFLGSGTYGPRFGAPVEVLADTDGSRRLVRDAQGNEVVSELLLRLPPKNAAGADTEPLYPPGSTVIFRGRVSTVITVKAYTRFGQTQYVEITTT